MERYNESELLYLMRCGSQEAQEYLYDNYYRYVEYWFSGYVAHCQFMEKEDFIQMAMIHFSKILDSYREDQVASLKTYMYISLKKRMWNVLYSVKRKRIPPNGYSISLDEPISKVEDSGLTYEETTEDPYKRYYPRLNLIVKEQETYYRSSISQSATPLELSVIKLKEEGYSDQEISLKLNVSVKCVYNASYRYHKKLQTIDDVK